MNDNRLQFSGGRGIRLEPPQQGQPLNYFIYPYAELAAIDDGVCHASLHHQS
jgi:hypothetical protein